MRRCGPFGSNPLKFHKLGQTKRELPGDEYAYRDKGDMDDAHMERLQEMFLDGGVMRGVRFHFRHVNWA